uniref:Uncharacterized protein n=1 Tax=Panagrolaimus superbus TaxID=310955 RepID=A0A914Y7E8_9BILA
MTVRCSDDAVTFLFKEEVVFQGDGDLDPIGLEWDGNSLFACFVDENTPDELIVGLKLTDTLEIMTTYACKGPYQQIDEHSQNPATSVAVAAVAPKTSRKATNISNTVFERQKLTSVKNEIAELQSNLPVPEFSMLRVDALVHDLSVRNVSESGVNAVLELMNSGTWNAENYSPLTVNKINGRYLVFEGNESLKAMKEFQRLNGNDPKYKFKQKLLH